MHIGKAGKTISGATAGAIKTAVDSMKAAMEKLMSLVSGETDMKNNMRKGDDMPITEEAREQLPDEVKTYLGDLEVQVKKVEGLETKVKELEKKDPDKEDILKGLPEEVRKRIEDAEGKAKEATDLAKAEREMRITKQYEDEAKGFPKLGKPEKIAKMLRSADEQGEAEGKDFRETLKAAQAKIDENDLLTKELGRSISDSVDSAWAKIEAKANELVQKNDKLSKEQAIKKVLETEEGQTLYAEYERSEK